MHRLLNPAVARTLDLLDEVEDLNASLRRVAAPAIAITASTITIGEIVSRTTLPARIIKEITHV